MVGRLTLGVMMKTYKGHLDDNSAIYWVDKQESEEVLLHRRRTRKLLEDRMERKRLRQELDDFDTSADNLEDEFDWHDDSK